jgi:hypothetical protein
MGTFLQRINMGIHKTVMQEVADIWSEVYLMAQSPYTTEGYEIWCWLNEYTPGQAGSRIGYVRALQKKIEGLKANLRYEWN